MDETNPLWKSRYQTNALIQESLERDSIYSMYCLSSILSSCWMNQSLVFDQEWDNAIHLNEYGTKVIDDLEEIRDVPEEIKKLALFMIFFHEDIFIDTERSDIDKISLLINKMISADSIRFPNFLGRNLYDKFAEQDKWYAKSHLSPEESDELLSGVPNGIFQIGNWIVGPLGLLNIGEIRYSPTTTDVPLWHCPNIDCEGYHKAKLYSYRNNLFWCINTINSHLKNKSSLQKSEWRGSILSSKESLGTGIEKYYNIITFLGDAIVGDELDKLMIRMLKSNNRSKLAEILKKLNQHNLIKGHPDEIVNNLNSSQKIQLICLLHNKEIVLLLDKCIINEEIVISPYDLRRPKISPPKKSKDCLGIEVSRFGSRLSQLNSFEYLVDIIWSSYITIDSLDDLAWKISVRDRKINKDDLIKYIRGADIYKIISELIVNDRKVSVAVCEMIDLGVDFLIESDLAVKMIAYKIGFNPLFEEVKYKTMQSRIDSFFNTIISFSKISKEEDREQIRSSGVNLFVAVEEFLEEIVVYNTWLISSDHYAETKFKYDYIKAREHVINILGEVIESGDSKIKWSALGGNTLGTAFTYFAGLIRWLKEKRLEDRSKYLKDLRKLPSILKLDGSKFYLKHSQLWADTNETQFSTYIEDLEDIYRALNESKFISIRNSIDHKRDDGEFPDLESLLNCVNQVRRAFILANSGRFVPKSFHMCRSQRDEYDRREYMLSDYDQNIIIRYGPEMYEGMPKYTFGLPIIISPGDLLGHSNVYLNFLPQKRSAYSDYWEGFPIRKPDLVGRKID